MDTLDWSLSPAPSTSWSDPGPTPRRVGGLGPDSPATSVASTGARKLVCARCRKMKEKCAWSDQQNSCTRCRAKGINCSGPTAVSTPTPFQVDSNDTTDWLAAFSQTQQNSTRALTTSRPVPCSPYRTAAGRPRLLGPSSSEASLNTVSRAGALRVELIDLYRAAWPVQLTSLPPDAFEGLLQGGGDSVSKAFLAICTALGARSSSHSEIVQRIGPLISTVDNDVMGQLTPGGYSEWGQRRHGACVALGRKAADAAVALVESQPSFRTLKLAMAAYSLNTTFHGDYRGRRPYLLLAVRTWRKLVVDPKTTTEELGSLLNGLGHVILIRDFFHSLCYGHPTEFSPAEARILCDANPIIPDVDCFGFPDPTNYSGLFVLDESYAFDIFFRVHLHTLHALAQVFGTGPLVNFGAREVDVVMRIWDYIDSYQTELERRLEAMAGVPKGDVLVRHHWRGNWRPAEPHAHAVVLFGEAIAETNDIAMILHTRLQIELGAGRLDVADPAVAGLAVAARERARRAMKAIARSIAHWMAAPRKHATFANIFSYLINVPDWIDLALARFGDAGGPVAVEDELSVDEVELLVRGLRVGSFSQSTLVIPLRELERGLEELRKAEAVAASNLNDFDLDQYLVTLNFVGEGNSP